MRGEDGEREGERGGRVRGVRGREEGEAGEGGRMEGVRVRGE